MTTVNRVNLFSINSSSGIPIYRQLVDQIKQSIRMGLLKPNDQLPSVRKLASELQINPMTISKAFAHLEIENVLVRKRGVGMLVGEQLCGSELTAEIERPLMMFIENARKKNFDDESIITLIQQYLSIQSKENNQ